MVKNIGINVQDPKRECNDPDCPFHGSLKVRGQIIEGRVVNNNMQGTAVIKKEYYRYIPKYERYEKRNSNIQAHVPDCIKSKPGDIVRIMECRPLSKSTKFVIIEKKEV